MLHCPTRQPSTYIIVHPSLKTDDSAIVSTQLLLVWAQCVRIPCIQHRDLCYRGGTSLPCIFAMDQPDRSNDIRHPILGPPYTCRVRCKCRWTSRYTMRNVLLSLTPYLYNISSGFLFIPIYDSRVHYCYNNNNYNYNKNFIDCLLLSIPSVPFIRYCWKLIERDWCYCIRYALWYRAT